MQSPFTWESAYHLRCEHGLSLPITGEFENEELRQICINMGRLQEEMLGLDRKIYEKVLGSIPLDFSA